MIYGTLQKILYSGNNGDFIQNSLTFAGSTIHAGIHAGSGNDVVYDTLEEIDLSVLGGRGFRS